MKALITYIVYYTSINAFLYFLFLAKDSLFALYKIISKSSSCESPERKELQLSRRRYNFVTWNIVMTLVLFLNGSAFYIAMGAMWLANIIGYLEGRSFDEIKTKYKQKELIEKIQDLQQQHQQYIDSMFASMSLDKKNEK